MWLLLAVAHAATITPTTTADDFTVNGNCTLREAVQAASTNTAVDACPAGSSSTDTIVLGPGTFRLTGAGGDDNNATGDLDLRGSIVLRGQGAGVTVLQGVSDRVIDVHPGATVVVERVTITAGAVPAGVPAVADIGKLFSELGGGGLRNAGTLTVRDATITGNRAGNGTSSPFGSGTAGWPGGGGGGLASTGTLTVERCVITGNTAGNGGSGTEIGGFGGYGGGIWAKGALTVRDTVIAGNTTGTAGTGPPYPTFGGPGGGGGIAVVDNDPVPTATLVSVTVSGNTTATGGKGGGLLGAFSLDSVTVASNTAGTGGGVVPKTSFTARRSIVANNGASTGPDCGSWDGTQVVSAGWLLVRNPSGCPLGAQQGTDQRGVDPLLGALVTGFHALQTGSPAIDAGGTGCPATDQRGTPRPIAGACDLGAVETGCGDGTTQSGEECDDAGASPTCTDRCTWSECGDGLVNAGIGEVCDWGASNANTPDTCRTNCRLPTCGDAVKDAFETCDAGAGSAACDPDCTAVSCGDGLYNPFAEECDDGTNSNAPDACRPGCIAPFCGDNVRDPLHGEACDAGLGNSDTTPNACRTDCAVAWCGDAIVDTGETCDDGVNNSDTRPGACRTTCTQARCGDDALDPGEACDDGVLNSDTEPDACREDCALPTCGDGTVDAGEVCDEGDLNSDTEPDACRTDCTLPSCGDGVTDATEQCDDADANSDRVPDACRTDCRAPSCGDAVLDMGEECDEGEDNANASDSCRPTCQLAYCGDGIVDSRERCDDGPDNHDLVPGACRTDCVNATCGDGLIDPGEQCDDGNRTDRDGCTGCAVDADYVCVYEEGGSRCGTLGGCATVPGEGGPWVFLVALLAVPRRRPPQLRRPGSDASGEDPPCPPLHHS